MCLSVVILRRQPNAGCRSPCVAWLQVLYFLSGTTDDWHITPLTSSPVHIGCVTVYLITISCYTTAMTLSRWPPSTKWEKEKRTFTVRVGAAVHWVSSCTLLRGNMLFCSLWDEIKAYSVNALGAKRGQCAFALGLRSPLATSWCALEINRTSLAFLLADSPSSGVT